MWITQSQSMLTPIVSDFREIGANSFPLIGVRFATLTV